MRILGMRSGLVILFLLCCISIDLYAQKEGYFWYYGNRAGLDFNPVGMPTVVTDGAMSTAEGCATIAEGDGDLLFYTSGIDVYNRFHASTPNGFGLMGNSSSTQSGVIVPLPTDPNIFYIFTVDDVGGPNGFRYTEFDMRLDGGKGDVVVSTKNTLLLHPSSEKITSVVHKNGRDIWVITHKYYTDSFYAWLVTPSGISATPVKSRAGTIHTSGLGLGYLKANTTGTQIASALWNGLNKWEVFDFDNGTGKLSNAFTLDWVGYTSNYGVEFSPSGQYLYGSSSSNSDLIQYDLWAGTPTDIQASGMVVGTSAFGRIGGMQIAPDGKIYCAGSFGSYTQAILDPDMGGMACSFQDSAIYHSIGTVQWGVPTFIQSFFNPINFEYLNTCLGDTTFFFIRGDTGSIDSVLWNFGDPGSGTMNWSKDINTWHIYGDTGIYEVCVIRWDSAGFIDTTCQVLEILDEPEVVLPADTLLCSSETLTLISQVRKANILWSDSSTNDTLIINSPGTYWLQANNICGEDRDSIVVWMEDPLVPDLGNDTALCVGQSLGLDASQSGGVEYAWSTGESTSNISISGPGTYSVAVTNVCGTYYDSITVSYSDVPSFSFSAPDSTGCIGDAVPLSAYYPEADYLWFNGSTDSFTQVSFPGTYWVRISNYCGEVYDSVLVLFENCCEPALPNAFSPNQDGVNDEFGLIQDYCLIDDYQLKIFNRLGQLVFESSDPKEFWDGKKGGKDLDLGVYVYTLKYSVSFFDNTGTQGVATPFISHGNVTLLR